ncbi:hypothetical protein RhiirA1_478803 [Rhizophagus irregularis]|uniref:Uncharacterized protein n=1 Tax=Rhizophagus irregularis TaxID=588596 RepID=A0A2N0QRI8_9GLOM|nr:hypothetical protein RhiirA1_478803 [Rhizophagus irregularis]
MAFNQTYSNLLAKLLASLINEAWIRLTSWKRKPLSEKKASKINPIVESFLKHEAIRYLKRLIRTFEKFMLDIEKEYRERINANKKLRCEIDNLKMQVEETEKELASMKSDSSH